MREADQEFELVEWDWHYQEMVDEERSRLTEVTEIEERLKITDMQETMGRIAKKLLIIAKMFYSFVMIVMAAFASLFLYTLEWNIYVKIFVELIFIEFTARRIYRAINVTFEKLDEQMRKSNK